MSALLRQHIRITFIQFFKLWLLKYFYNENEVLLFVNSTDFLQKPLNPVFCIFRSRFCYNWYLLELYVLTIFSRPLSVKYNDYFLLLLHSTNNGRSKLSRTCEKPIPTLLSKLSIPETYYMDTLVEHSNFKHARFMSL